MEPKPDKKPALNEGRGAIAEISERLNSNWFRKKVKDSCVYNETARAYTHVEVVIDKTTGIPRHLEAISNPMYGFDSGGLQCLEQGPSPATQIIEKNHNKFGLVEISISLDGTIENIQPSKLFPPSEQAISCFGAAVRGYHNRKSPSFDSYGMERRNISKKEK